MSYTYRSKKKNVVPAAARTADGLIPASLGVASRIFRKKGWSFGEESTPEDNFVFNNYVRMISLLSPGEQYLLLKLTNDFIRIGLNDYITLFDDALNQVPETMAPDGADVFIVPILKKADIDAHLTKSGNFSFYLNLAAVIPYCARFERCNIRRVDTIYDLPGKRGAARNCCVLMVDDFIGTGDTVDDFIEIYESTFKEQGDSVAIVAVAALKTGVDAMEDMGYSLFAGLIQGKGIADSQSISDKKHAYSLMNAIESRLDVMSFCNNGYRGSEALIKLLRCPDNTFPVFWCDRTSDGKEWPAPFRRVSY